MRPIRIAAVDPHRRELLTAMFGLGPATKIFLAIHAVDMRKGFDGLYGVVRDVVWSRNSERVLNPRLEKMQAG